MRCVQRRISLVQPIFAPRNSRARFAPRLAATLAIVLVPLSVVLAFFWAPIATISLDASGAVQYDFPQKIFYLHVPVAMAAYVSFAAGAWNGLLYLLRGSDDHDIRSYAGVHTGMVFGTLVLVTGSIWAKAAWGTWFQWGDRQLVVFLILYLFYGAYFMVRFSIDEPRARAQASAVYAVLGVVLVPFSFLAIRIADTLIHPIVITESGLQMTRPMGVTFVLGIIGWVATAMLMNYLETLGKLRSLRGYCAREHDSSAGFDVDAGSEATRQQVTSHA